MIPNPKPVAVLKHGVLATEKAGIAKDGLAWVLKQMTDLYSDRDTAIIREYSTNAYDAQLEKGNAHIPIEVTLSNVLRATFAAAPLVTRRSLKELKIRS